MLKYFWLVFTALYHISHHQPRYLQSVLTNVEQYNFIIIQFELKSTAKAHVNLWGKNNFLTKTQLKSGKVRYPIGWE